MVSLLGFSHSDRPCHSCRLTLNAPRVYADGCSVCAPSSASVCGDCCVFVEFGLFVYCVRTEVQQLATQQEEVLSTVLEPWVVDAETLGCTEGIECSLLLCFPLPSRPADQVFCPAGLSFPGFPATKSCSCQWLMVCT